jgi:hypothetical protein
MLGNGWVNTFHISAKTDSQAAIKEILERGVFYAVRTEVI